MTTACVVVSAQGRGAIGWDCCQCTAYNGAKRPACIRCGHLPCGAAEGLAAGPARPSRPVRCGGCGELGHNVQTCPAGDGVPRALPPGARAAADALARSIGRLGDRPEVRAALLGLETALPETGAQVRAALADPGELLGRLAAHVGREALRELAEDDRALAAGLGRLVRGIVKKPRR